MMVAMTAKPAAVFNQTHPTRLDAVAPHRNFLITRLTTVVRDILSLASATAVNIALNILKCLGSLRLLPNPKSAALLGWLRYLGSGLWVRA
jgi:hypothetical protein